MKKLFFTTFLTLACFVISFGQIEEAQKAMSTGVETAFSIVIPDASEKDMGKIWKSYMKPYKGKTKKSRKTNEFFTDNATIPELSSNSVDVYAKMNEVNGEVLLSVWFDLGGGFLSSETHPDKVSAAQILILQYALEVSKKATGDELKSEKKNLKKLGKELTKLEKVNTKLHQDIEMYKRKIKEAEANIKKNDAEQVNKNEEINNQKEKVEGVKKKLEELDN